MKYRFECAECGYAYKSFWYEPNWIARRFYEADHISFHHNSWLNDYPSQWKRYGAEIERARIIKLLEEYLALTEYSEQVEDAQSNPEWTNGFQSAIALIKGEK